MRSYVFFIICLILVLYRCSERSPRLKVADDLPTSAPHYTGTRSEAIQLGQLESNSRKAKAVASDYGGQRYDRVNTPAESVSNIETGTMSYAAGVLGRLKAFLPLCDLNSIAELELCSTELGIIACNKALLSIVQEVCARMFPSFFTLREAS
jgi:hypothetical protein